MRPTSYPVIDWDKVFHRDQSTEQVDLKPQTWGVLKPSLVCCMMLWGRINEKMENKHRREKGKGNSMSVCQWRVKAGEVCEQLWKLALFNSIVQ